MSSTGGSWLWTDRNGLDWKKSVLYDWNGLDWRKLVLDRREWLGLDKFGFWLTGMVWTGGSRFWTD
jgi:hypothetical protein